MIRQINENEIKTILKDIWSFKNPIDWSDLNYGIEKAYLGSVLSQISYCIMTDDEREAATRAKIIPSDIFQSIQYHRNYINVIDIAREMDIPINIIYSRYLVVLIIEIQNMLMIAVRGTQFLYELRIDVDANKYYMVDDANRFAHAGFYRETLKMSARISRYIYNKYPQTMPEIAVFGHSLGGAIAAMFNYTGFVDLGGWRTDYAKHCYVFGAPRIVDFSTVMKLRVMATRRVGDLVPNLPPRAWGYGDYLEEFTCSGVDWHAGSAEQSWLKRTIARFQPLNPLAAHKIEGYRTNIAASVP